MSDHRAEEDKPSSYTSQYQHGNLDDELGHQITHVLNHQAANMHFSPDIREKILQRLPAEHPAPSRIRPKMAISLGFVVLILVIFSLLFSFVANRPGNSTTQAYIQYYLDKSISTPAQLAMGGRIVSLDPTGHHLVYMPANEPGVLYTTDLSDTITKNLLAMRDARDVSWAPDGSAMVTTIHSAGTASPLLALVPDGEYMHLLGHDAFAVSWNPGTNGEITYAIQSNGQTELWGTNQLGNTTHLLAKMQLSLIVQHIVWSPDGHKLALIGTSGSTTSPELLDQVGHAIYIMDNRDKSFNELVSPDDFTIGSLGWSADGQNILYEQIDRQNHTTLQAINTTTQHSLFTIAIQHSLEGWSWSPDGRNIIYSDGGVLRTFTLQGLKLQLPDTKTSLVTPFWLPDGNILCLNISNGIGQLAILAKR